ncbi:tetratricopeptide repeat protein [Roseivirga sp. BDSF3-8]|uniref:tetratricopeptide repeat protein n=1 Tax=Roseivirga sp. BDSF3-8 TaxID=3241598 RepID=UPI003532431C
MKKLLVLFFLAMVLIPNPATAQSPGDHIELADTLLWNDEYEKVKYHLQQADSILTLAPDPDARLYYQIILGDYYLDQQQYPQAAEAYEPLLKMKAHASEKMRLKLAKAINDLGITYYHLGEMQRARTMHHQSLILYDGDLQGISYNYNNLAIIAKQQKTAGQRNCIFQEKSGSLHRPAG